MARAQRDLTRAEGLEAALALAERDGLESLTMRKIAAAVGVEPMSLYNHVKDKEGILDGLIEVVFARFELPARTGDWLRDVEALARSFRRLALSYPRTAPLVLTRRLAAPARLHAAETALAIFRDAGFSVEETVHAITCGIAPLLTEDSHLDIFPLTEGSPMLEGVRAAGCQLLGATQGARPWWKFWKER